MKLTRTRIFGIALMLYALLSTGLVYWSMTENDFEVSSDILIIVGGLLMFFAGFVIAIKEEFDKMYAIGLYAVTFGIYKILRAYSVMNVRVGDFSWNRIEMIDIISVVTIILAIPFILIGISYLLGLAKHIWRKVFFSLVLIVLSFVSLMEFAATKNIAMAVNEAIEIAVLAFFVLLLLSKDVRVNTAHAKHKYGRRIARSGKKDAKVKYKAAKKRAEEAREAGDDKLADEIVAEAKEEYKEDVAKAEKAEEKSEKVRYYYNEETGKVEVKK